MGIQRRVCDSALLSFLTCMEKLAVKRLKELVVADRRTVDVHALSLTTSLQQLQDVYVTTPPNSHSGGSPSAATVTRAASPRRREFRCRWCPAGRPPSPASLTSSPASRRRCLSSIWRWREICRRSCVSASVRANWMAFRVACCDHSHSRARGPAAD